MLLLSIFNTNWEINRIALVIPSPNLEKITLILRIIDLLLWLAVSVKQCIFLTTHWCDTCHQRDTELSLDFRTLPHSKSFKEESHSSYEGGGAFRRTNSESSYNQLLQQQDRQQQQQERQGLAQEVDVNSWRNGSVDMTLACVEWAILKHNACNKNSNVCVSNYPHWLVCVSHACKCSDFWRISDFIYFFDHFCESSRTVEKFFDQKVGGKLAQLRDVFSCEVLDLHWKVKQIPKNHRSTNVIIMTCAYVLSVE